MSNEFANNNDASSTSTTTALGNKCSALIPPVSEERIQLLQQQHGVTLTPMEPLGAKVTNMDWNNKQLLQPLQEEMAQRGFLVFTDQGVMTPEEQIEKSAYFAPLESTHGVHPKAGHSHIFRLSNDPSEGILGVGPQWHNDGSFLPGTFSYVGYHIVRVPEKGGGTIFCHQGAAFDRLSEEDQAFWSRLVSVNSNSGVVRPCVHKHPVSGRQSIWLHLGMTGAVIECNTSIGEQQNNNYRLLKPTEMRKLFHQYNDLLDAGLEEGYSIKYEYSPGDFVVIDNLAIGHKAAPEAHVDSEEQGLRIVHRTTMQATQAFAGGFGLPQVLDVYAPNPFNKDGVWIGGGVGFRWDDFIHMQN